MPLWSAISFFPSIYPLRRGDNESGLILKAVLKRDENLGSKCGALGAGRDGLIKYARIKVNWLNGSLFPFFLKLNSFVSASAVSKSFSL